MVQAQSVARSTHLHIVQVEKIPRIRRLSLQSAVSTDPVSGTCSVSDAVKSRGLHRQQHQLTYAATNATPPSHPKSQGKVPTAVKRPSVLANLQPPVLKEASKTSTRTAVREQNAVSTTTAVQLRLSTNLVKILLALNKAGQNPCELVENILWEDSRVRDAATILKLRRLVPRHNPAA